MEWFENLSKSSQKLIVGASIFCGSFLMLIIGGSISHETAFGISIPMVIVGIFGTIVGFVCLVFYLTDWWEQG